MEITGFPTTKKWSKTYHFRLWKVVPITLGIRKNPYRYFLPCLVVRNSDRKWNWSKNIGREKKTLSHCYYAKSLVVKNTHQYIFIEDYTICTTTKHITKLNCHRLNSKNLIVFSFQNFTLKKSLFLIVSLFPLINTNNISIILLHYETFPISIFFFHFSVRNMNIKNGQHNQEKNNTINSQRPNNIVFRPRAVLSSPGKFIYNNFL